MATESQRTVRGRRSGCRLLFIYKTATRIGRPPPSNTHPLGDMIYTCLFARACHLVPRGMMYNYNDKVVFTPCKR